MPTKPNDKPKNLNKPKRKTREIRNPKTGELAGSQSLDGQVQLIFQPHQELPRRTDR